MRCHTSYIHFQNKSINNLSSSVLYGNLNVFVHVHQFCLSLFVSLLISNSNFKKKSEIDRVHAKTTHNRISSGVWLFLNSILRGIGEFLHFIMQEIHTNALSD